MSDEQELRQLFGQLRAADTAAAPAFASLLRRERISMTRLAPVGVILVLAVLITLWTPVLPPPKVSITEWRSPTEFLLEPASADLFRGIPELGQPAEEVFRCEDCF